MDDDVAVPADVCVDMDDDVAADTADDADMYNDMADNVAADMATGADVGAYVDVDVADGMASDDDMALTWQLTWMLMSSWRPISLRRPSLVF